MYCGLLDLRAEYIESWGIMLLNHSVFFSLRESLLMVLFRLNEDCNF